MPKYTQTNRPARVDTPLGKDVLLLYGFDGKEGISVPFEFRLELLSEDPSVDPDALLGQPMTVVLELGARGTRIVHGLVRRFVQRGRRKDLTLYEAEIVPKLWFLGLTQDSRIFQEKSVPEIVEQVFGEQGITDWSNRCTGSYPKREYCVQYRETDLAFVSRLLEEEGIFYFFEFDPGSKKHVLVLADANSAIKPCKGQEKAPYLPLSTGEDAVVHELAREASVHSTKVTLRDYDFLQPKLTLEAEVAGEKPEWEVYDYPGEFTDKGEAKRYARIRLEERELQGKAASGRSSCPAFKAGTKMELTGHFDAKANRTWTLTSVHHRYTGGDYLSGERSAEEYENHFTVAPDDLPVRPRRVTPRPTVKGSQTAMVVGPKGEEIHVDKHGRVKVQFYWDREGKKDESSSCWMRVASGWAGKNWGEIHIPRIGQEVLVDFLEGDPDRPLVTGSVYNADQMPPYALPGDKTQSGIKSRSSRGGGTSDFNEVRFEDKKGSEEIYVHAEKDLRTLVENDQKLWVGNERDLEIENDERKKINSGSQTVEIVKGDQEITLGQGDRTVTVEGGNLKTKVAKGGIEYEAMQKMTLKVGQSSIELTPTGIKLTSVKIELKADAQVQVKGAMLKLEGSAMSELKAPMTTVKGDGMLVLKGGVTMIN